MYNLLYFLFIIFNFFLFFIFFFLNNYFYFFCFIDNMTLVDLLRTKDEDLVAITKKVHVYHNIEAFPDKFETLLGERGVNLSGGQKQRVSIARALIGKPKLLVLDDCLSAVDTETEDIILENLKQDETPRTSIIVSHRISSIRNADKVIVIDHGEKIEEGSHETLLQNNGIYAEMYKKQLVEGLQQED